MIAHGLLTVRQVYDLCLPDEPLADSTRRLRHYQLNRWERYSCDPVIHEIDTGALCGFRRKAIAGGMSPETVETTISAVVRILRAAVEEDLIQRVPRRGKRASGPPIRTAKISMEEFDRFLAAIPRVIRTQRRPLAWWIAFWATPFFTALRLANVQALRWPQISAESLDVRAFKTGKLQAIPVHPVYRRLLEEHRDASPAECLFRIGRKTLYRVTEAIRSASGVEGVTPQAVRALAARTYEKAHAGAGRLILGHGLEGATAYYLSVPEILESACERLRVPPCLLTDAERDDGARREKFLVAAFRELREEDRQAILRMLSSLRRHRA